LDLPSFPKVSSLEAASATTAPGAAQN
jgi:hypothetical protein